MLREVVFLMCIVTVLCQESQFGGLDTDSYQDKMAVRPDFLNIHRRSGSRSKPKEVEGVPKCTPNPCKNNGFCRPHDTCICPAEYTGTLCDDLVLSRCGFEKDMCISAENFKRTNSYSGIPAPSKGQYYALATGSAIMAANLTVQVKSLRIDFDCVTSGSGGLNLVIGHIPKSGLITTNGKWKSYSFDLPAIQNME
ncbi:uncharacterized protein LOC134241078, partial [Saccostrea cucullata]|uniref:uncharacterized protein LOC134241078 n=1 Tax=Saccostrea cuccullata TaxID=36930 RepID=UPI002ED492FC